MLSSTNHQRLQNYSTLTNYEGDTTISGDSTIYRQAILINVIQHQLAYTTIADVVPSVMHFGIFPSDLFSTCNSKFLGKFWTDLKVLNLVLALIIPGEFSFCGPIPNFGVLVLRRTVHRFVSHLQTHAGYGGDTVACVVRVCGCKRGRRGRGCKVVGVAWFQSWSGELLRLQAIAVALWLAVVLTVIGAGTRADESVKKWEEEGMMEDCKPMRCKLQAKMGMKCQKLM